MAITCLTLGDGIIGLYGALQVRLATKLTINSRTLLFLSSSSCSCNNRQQDNACAPLPRPRACVTALGATPCDSAHTPALAAEAAAVGTIHCVWSSSLAD